MKDKTIKEIMNEDKKELNETSLGSFLSNQENIETTSENQTESEKQTDNVLKETNVVNKENDTIYENAVAPEQKLKETVTKLEEPKTIKQEPAPARENVTQVKQKKTKSKKKIKVILLSLFAVVILSLFGLFVYQYMANKPEIELIATKITAEYGSDIDYNAYIQSYNATELEIKEIDTNILGEQIALYKAKNGLISNEKELVIEVVDTKAPEFSLTTDIVEIERSEISSFRCYDYIDTATFKDNCDGFENMKYTCPALADIDEKTNAVVIRYVLSDSSGNESYKELKVIIK